MLQAKESIAQASANTQVTGPSWTLAQIELLLRFHLAKMMLMQKMS